jgi:hypothetical protein
MEIDDRFTLAAVLFAGVAIPGVSSYLLSEIGADTLSQVIWLVGYGGMVLFVWYHWLRPMDLQGA